MTFRTLHLKRIFKSPQMNQLPYSELKYRESNIQRLRKRPASLQVVCEWTFISVELGLYCLTAESVCSLINTSSSLDAKSSRSFILLSL